MDPLARRSHGEIIERVARLGVVLLRPGEMRIVPLFLQPRQQCWERGADVADNSEVDGGTTPNVLGSKIDLRDAYATPLRIELAIRESVPSISRTSQSR